MPEATHCYAASKYYYKNCFCIICHEKNCNLVLELVEIMAGHVWGTLQCTSHRYRVMLFEEQLCVVHTSGPQYYIMKCCNTVQLLSLSHSSTVSKLQSRHNMAAQILPVGIDFSSFPNFLSFPSLASGPVK